MHFFRSVGASGGDTAREPEPCDCEVCEASLVAGEVGW